VAGLELLKHQQPPECVVGLIAFGSCVNR
jgi:hypothetical protein